MQREKSTNRTKAERFRSLRFTVNTPIDCCEQRDPKGLYKQARDAVSSGKGMGFTGVDDPYEAPVAPELTFDATTASVADGVALVLNYLASKGLVA